MEYKNLKQIIKENGINTKQIEKICEKLERLYWLNHGNIKYQEKITTLQNAFFEIQNFI